MQIAEPHEISWFVNFEKELRTFAYYCKYFVKLWTRRGTSIAAGCFPVSLMCWITIFLMCLPQCFKAMQSAATLLLRSGLESDSKKLDSEHFCRTPLLQRWPLIRVMRFSFGPGVQILWKNSPGQESPFKFGRSRSLHHRGMAWGCRECGRIPNAGKLAVIRAKILKIWANFTATFTFHWGSVYSKLPQFMFVGNKDVSPNIPLGNKNYPKCSEVAISGVLANRVKIFLVLGKFHAIPSGVVKQL